VEPSPRAVTADHVQEDSRVHQHANQQGSTTHAHAHTHAHANVKSTASLVEVEVEPVPVPVEKSAYVRRSIMDEGIIGAAPVSEWVSQKHQSIHKHSEVEGGVDECVSKEKGMAGMVRVDVNRLSVYERREKTVLRKLLQAKGLMTSGIVSDGMSGNNSERSSVCVSECGEVECGDRVVESEALSASVALEKKIVRSQEVISILEEAIMAEGVMRAEDAIR
jgi:hypothetical protein